MERVARTTWETGVSVIRSDTKPVNSTLYVTAHLSH